MDRAALGVERADGTGRRGLLDELCDIRLRRHQRQRLSGAEAVPSAPETSEIEVPDDHWAGPIVAEERGQVEVASCGRETPEFASRSRSGSSVGSASAGYQEESALRYAPIR